MIILSIDTSTMRGSVALVRDGELLGLSNQTTESSHSEWLFDHIDLMLKRSNVGFKDIAGIAVAVGPGSFTGLRIGVAAAKGISFALGIPIVGFSSLYSLALNVTDTSYSFVLSVIDARRDEVYAAGYRIDGSTLTEILEEGVFKPNALAERIDKIGEGFLLVGDGAARYKKEIQDIAKKTIIDDELLYSNSSHIGFEALKELSSARGGKPNELKLNYIRRSDAEIGFLGRK